MRIELDNANVLGQLLEHELVLREVVERMMPDIYEHYPELEDDITLPVIIGDAVMRTIHNRWKEITPQEV